MATRLRLEHSVVTLSQRQPAGHNAAGPSSDLCLTHQATDLGGQHLSSLLQAVSQALSAFNSLLCTVPHVLSSLRPLLCVSRTEPQVAACRYTGLDPVLLPPLWLILKSPGDVSASSKHSTTDSGTVHSSVRQRWLQGDPAVQAGMDQIASKAAQGR